MPWYRLVTYRARSVHHRRFQARNRHEATGRYLAECERPGVTHVRLEDAAGRHLLGCEAHGTVTQQGRLPLGVGR